MKKIIKDPPLTFFRKANEARQKAFKKALPKAQEGLDTTNRGTVMEQFRKDNNFATQDQLKNYIKNNSIEHLNARNKAFYDSLGPVEPGMVRDAYVDKPDDRHLKHAQMTLGRMQAAEKYLRDYDTANPMGRLPIRPAMPIQKKGGTVKAKKALPKAQKGTSVKATADSTKYYKQKFDDKFAIGKSLSKLGATKKVLDRYVSEGTKAYTDMSRQKYKGKPGYDKNGFPIKKKK